MVFFINVSVSGRLLKNLLTKKIIVLGATPLHNMWNIRKEKKELQFIHGNKSL